MALSFYPGRRQRPEARRKTPPARAGGGTAPDKICGKHPGGGQRPWWDAPPRPGSGSGEERIFLPGQAANPLDDAADAPVDDAQLGGDLLVAVALQAQLDDLALQGDEPVEEVLQLIQERHHRLRRRLAVEQLQDAILSRLALGRLLARVALAG